MFNFLHTYNPTPILITFGPINVYWYGLFLFFAIIVGLIVFLQLVKEEKIDKNISYDLFFYSMIFGVIGAIVNVPFAIFLGRHFGISGVILSSIILGISGFFILPIQYHKIISGTATGIWGK